MSAKAPAEPPDIDLRAVTYAYPATSIPVLDHVDWQVVEGAFVVVAGPSGSGKSTLLRCLNGLVPHFSGGRFGGSVHIRGTDTRTHGPRALSRTVGFVFQEPEAQGVAAIVDDELAFGMEQLGVPPATMRKRVEEVLDLLGIAALRDRELATLSGGERQRVAVAAALALQPRVLVLDEPTSQLDPWGAEDVFSALARLNEDLGLTVVVAEHRLERVLAHADRLRVLGADPIDDVPTRALAAMAPSLLPPLARLARALGWHSPPLSVKEARLAARMDTRIPASPPPDDLAPGGPPIVQLAGVSAKHGSRTVLRKLDFEIRPGELVALMGRNGSGKSTLLRTMIGFHPADSGRIEIGGIDVRRAGREDVVRRIGYLPQRPSSLLFNATVREEIAFTLKHRPGPPGAAADLMAELDLTALADRYPRDLSAGEQERTALAAVLAGRPPLLLLDEPTRGMDAARKLELATLLKRELARGTAIVMATHDIELVAACATRVVILGDGDIVVDGPRRAVLSGSLTLTTQINKLYGDGFLTVADVTGGLAEPVPFSPDPFASSHATPPGNKSDSNRD